ncbi:hypothetical protein FISHEDRAFT_72339 [Fistulina hepatica ATCC 64428]|uniref:C2H2-type domain-containing protein n=1 Tax=Fistulina hepatica ATCC 64428 TaxID=1128425 RepID=A0A0D7AEX4_9AGAR|nr:hypothetical protein FISHEDRAFT_72339 [Fistulina hepatica ATCC 64428]
MHIPTIPLFSPTELEQCLTRVRDRHTPQPRSKRSGMLFRQPPTLAGFELTPEELARGRSQSLPEVLSRTAPGDVDSVPRSIVGASCLREGLASVEDQPAGTGDDASPEVNVRGRDFVIGDRHCWYRYTIAEGDEEDIFRTSYPGGPEAITFTDPFAIGERASCATPPPSAVTNPTTEEHADAKFTSRLHKTDLPELSGREQAPQALVDVVSDTSQKSQLKSIMLPRIQIQHVDDQGYAYDIAMDDSEPSPRTRFRLSVVDARLRAHNEAERVMMNKDFPVRCPRPGCHSVLHDLTGLKCHFHVHDMEPELDDDDVGSFFESFKDAFSFCRDETGLWKRFTGVLACLVASTNRRSDLNSRQFQAWFGRAIVRKTADTHH